ncbi:hypothetical protein C5167_029172, partial [Papaver somniferum]
DPNHAAETACSTGAHSIGDAARMILFGVSTGMVAGGTKSIYGGNGGNLKCVRQKLKLGEIATPIPTTGFL